MLLVLILKTKNNIAGKGTKKGKFKRTIGLF